MAHENKQEPVELGVTEGSHHAQEGQDDDGTAHSNEQVGAVVQLPVVNGCLKRLFLHFQPCPQANEHASKCLGGGGARDG